MKNLKALILNHKTLEFEEVELKGEEIDYKFLHERLGWIEHLTGYNKYLDSKSISMWCDEEHKLKDKWEERICIAIMKGHVAIELLAGDIVFCKDTDDGRTLGLTDEEIEIVKTNLGFKAILSLKNGNTLAVRVLSYC